MLVCCEVFVGLLCVPIAGCFSYNYCFISLWFGVG